MGYRGKVQQQERARELRAMSWRLTEIAAELGVSKSSVSLWVRDVPCGPIVRRNGHAHGERGPNKLQVAKAEEIARLKAEGAAVIGRLSERDFLIAGTALYAGEGSKTDSKMGFANCDPRMMLFFVIWFRRFFDIDESRIRLLLYLHQGLDLEAAVAFWGQLLEIPHSQFGKPYRAVADPSIRHSKHPLGCPSVRYNSAPISRFVSGLMGGLLDCRNFPG